MKDKIKQFAKTKQFNICIVSMIIIFIIIISLFITLKYSVEGESNLPFNMTKISVISSVEGTDVEDTTNKWNLSVNQNNDIYIYIKKNDVYTKTETIKSIKLDNFIIETESEIGEIKLYKPDSNEENIIFNNNSENIVDEIEYVGDINSDFKNLKISNQGGIIVFRSSIINIGNYISNDDQEINHSELLNKLSINNEDLKYKITFDISINLDSDKTYKSTISLELPINDVVNQGTQSIEYTDLDNFVFKRT